MDKNQKRLSSLSVDVRPQSSFESSDSSCSDSEKEWTFYHTLQQVKKKVMNVRKGVKNLAQQRGRRHGKRKRKEKPVNKSKSISSKRQKRKAIQAPLIAEPLPSLAPVIDSEEEENNAKPISFNEKVIMKLHIKKLPGSTEWQVYRPNETGPLKPVFGEHGSAPVSTASATTPVCQAPVPSQTQPVPSEASPNSPSTPPKLTPAAELRARTPQIPSPPLDPAPPPLLSKPRERIDETDHPISNSYGANKAPELIAQPDPLNYTVGNQAPTITSSVTNGEKKMEEKPSPVSPRPIVRKQSVPKLKNEASWFKICKSAVCSSAASRMNREPNFATQKSFSKFKRLAQQKEMQQEKLERRLRQHQEENIMSLEKDTEVSRIPFQDSILNRRNVFIPVVAEPHISGIFHERIQKVRQEEQENRQRAVSQTINMNLQREILEEFEKSIDFSVSCWKPDFLHVT